MIKSLYRSLLAALSTYTRLPAWRLTYLQEEDYARAIQWLPIVGVVTGGLMAGVFMLSYYCLQLPLVSAIVLSLSARLLFTGAFHEDGLGDFFDGFGGGRERESILRIMKDSHVGSYAVIGYIIYYALLISLLSGLSVAYIPIVLVVSDVVGKYCGVLPVSVLPYARRLEESKLGLRYQSGFNLPNLFVLLMVLASPYLIGYSVLFVLPLPLMLVALLSYYIYRKIGGYTGDTCGAFILLSELAVVLSFVLFKYIS